MTEIEEKVKVLVGFTLWGIAAIITASLYASLAGTDSIRRIVMVVLACSLEGSKILCFRSELAIARVLSVILIILSLFAGLAASADIIETNRSQESSAQASAVEHSDQYKRTKTEVDSLDKQINLQLHRLSELPADYTSSAAKLSVELAALRGQRQNAAQRLETMQTRNGGTATNSGVVIFKILSDLTGLRSESWELGILLILTIGIEGSGLVLAGKTKSTTLKQPPLQNAGDMSHTTYASPMRPMEAPQGHAMTAVDFLKALQAGAELPYLHGRERTAAQLGIRSYTAKKFVKELIKNRLIEVHGKRLVLSTMPNQ